MVKCARHLFKYNPHKNYYIHNSSILSHIWGSKVKAKSLKTNVLEGVHLQTYI